MNYFAPLAHAERVPISREQVWSSLRGHGRLAHVARKRILEHQISEDAQVEQDESLTRNIKSNLILVSRTDSFQQGSHLLQQGERTVPRRYIKSAHWLKVGDDEGYFAVHKVMNSIQGEILTSEACVSVKRSGDLANGRRDV
jgi:hypothetical protein